MQWLIIHELFWLYDLLRSRQIWILMENKRNKSYWLVHVAFVNTPGQLLLNSGTCTLAQFRCCCCCWGDREIMIKRGLKIKNEYKSLPLDWKQCVWKKLLINSKLRSFWDPDILNVNDIHHVVLQSKHALLYPFIIQYCGVMHKHYKANLSF